jgi:hypothetical protein
MAAVDQLLTWPRRAASQRAQRSATPSGVRWLREHAVNVFDEGSLERPAEPWVEV